MVSNASELLPDPDNPVRTTSLSPGISMSMFLRLCSRAPRTLMRSCRAMKLESSLGALGICGGASEQTIAIYQCSICRAQRSGVSVQNELYQSNRTDSSLILVQLIDTRRERATKSSLGVICLDRQIRVPLSSSTALCGAGAIPRTDPYWLV